MDDRALQAVQPFPTHFVLQCIKYYSEKARISKYLYFFNIESHKLGSIGFSGRLLNFSRILAFGGQLGAIVLWKKKPGFLEKPGFWADTGKVRSHHVSLLLWMIDNFQIDETLLQEALTLGNHETNKAAIEAALREYVQHRKQLKVLELFGSIDYEEDYDYKQQRKKT